MNSKLSIGRMAVAAVVIAGISGVARANDGSMSPAPDNSSSMWRQSHPNGLSVREMQSLWGSWAGQYHLQQPVFSNAPADASFKESHPNGLSAREMQSLWGTWAGQFRLNQPAPSNAAADPYFRKNHPNGLSDRELEAMSSEAPAWKMPNRPVVA
jgi:hypothetical protein